MSNKVSAKYFVIVGHNDQPLFDIDLLEAVGEKKEEPAHLREFIAHAALDLVDEHMWQNNNFYLKVVDKFNQYVVSAFVTGSGIRFLLLHEGRADENVKKFMEDMYDLYTRAVMNPFFDENVGIKSPDFKGKVLWHAKRTLNLTT